jgi:hypothetical protein
VGAGEEVMAASEYRALPHQVREVQRLLGKKTLENEIPGLPRAGSARSAGSGAAKNGRRQLRLVAGVGAG